MSGKRGKEQGLVSAGTIVRATAELKPLTSVQMRLIESASEIREGQPDDIAFQHSVLCQTSLPYRSTPQRRWEAQNGNVMLLVQAGEAFDPNKRQWVELPLPFGPKARLILM